MRQWLESLRIPKKLWLFHLVTALTSGLVAAGIMLLTVWHIARGNAEADAGVKAAIIADNILPSLQFRDTEVAGEILKGLGRDKNVLQARVIEADGQVFAEFIPKTTGNHSQPSGDNVIQDRKSVV